MTTTFHRAFDTVDDPLTSIDLLIELDSERVAELVRIVGQSSVKK